jgi:hypothetical protein
MIKIVHATQRDHIGIAKAVQRGRVAITDAGTASLRGRLVLDFRQRKHMIAAAIIAQQ